MRKLLHLFLLIIFISQAEFQEVNESPSEDVIEYPNLETNQDSIIEQTNNQPNLEEDLVKSFEQEMNDPVDDEEVEYEIVPGCFATRNLQPLCASNGKSYANPSIFHCAKNLDPSLTIVDPDGPCTRNETTKPEVKNNGNT